MAEKTNQIIWKAVKGYENIYEISNTGIIRSISDHTIRKQYLDNVGYYTVVLYKEKYSKRRRVHRLLAEAFIPNPLNLPCINHKDENKANNELTNLEWCTKKYNNTYGNKIERTARKIRKPILQIDENDLIVKEWDSIKSASTALNISSVQISRYARGVIKGMYKGFYWKYKNSHTFKNKKGKRIGKFDSDGNLLETFDSITSAGNSSTVSSFTISNCINGYMKTAGGYYWKEL